jgi:hypothetical protein
MLQLPQQRKKSLLQKRLLKVQKEARLLKKNKLKQKESRRRGI